MFCFGEFVDLTLIPGTPTIPERPQETMYRTCLTRRILTFMMLISVSMAGLFGPALHSVAHLGSSSDSTVGRCSCTDCPFSRRSAEAEQQKRDEDQVKNDHDCAICRFLALSKQVDDFATPTVKVGSHTEWACQEYSFSLTAMFVLSRAPRGPPCC